MFDCTDMNKRAVENLIRAGAFDSMGTHRSQLIAVYEKVMDGISNGNRVNIEGQIVNNKNMNVYAGRYNFDPTEYVDANNLTVTQEDEYWVVNNNRR